MAELLGDGELAPNIATMGSRALAEIHGLQVIDDNLQDLDENFTGLPVGGATAQHAQEQ